ncbi:hypothetical protein STXM2123_5541 [Streptomyces sp. F-3]|nr:hypothetical protein STXM2123_5541 [Streptomyces sp. F-3]
MPGTLPGGFARSHCRRLLSSRRRSLPSPPHGPSHGPGRQCAEPAPLMSGSFVGPA